MSISTYGSFANHWLFCYYEIASAIAAVVAVDAQSAVETVVEIDHASCFDSAFVGPETIASVEACETVAKVAAYDSVALAEDSASEYFAVYEIEEEAVVCETEVTVAAYGSVEEAEGFAFVYFEVCATEVYVAAEEVAVYVAGASDGY